ncbi:MAG: hypothetical protein FWG27_04580 [Treponema sp.]|nr:hypothetical protein [Treponema sp.]
MDEKYDDGRITFYYSREERLKKASQSVKDLNNGVVPQKRGLFGNLTSTRPLTFLFISVVTLCLAVIILSRFLTTESSRVLGNNAVLVSIITAGDKSYITVKKTAKDGTAYTGAVDIAVSLPYEESPVYADRIYFIPEKEEIFRFAVPFTGKKILVLMEAGAQRVLLSITPET